MSRSTAGTSPQQPKFFASPAQLRSWLGRHHEGQDELWVGLYRKATGKPSITWPELVDQLLCFGWIDGVRKSIDADSYAIRITPRRERSNWSAVNLRRMAQLLAEGVVEPAGRAAYEARGETRSYSFEQEQVALPKALETEFRKNRAAWTFFTAQPPSYRRVATWWVVSAKREDTRRRRFETLVRDSADGQRIGPMRRADTK